MARGSGCRRQCSPRSRSVGRALLDHLYLFRTRANRSCRARGHPRGVSAVRPDRTGAGIRRGSTGHESTERRRLAESSVAVGAPTDHRRSRRRRSLSDGVGGARPRSSSDTLRPFQRPGFSTHNLPCPPAPRPPLRRVSPHGFALSDLAPVGSTRSRRAADGAVVVIRRGIDLIRIPAHPGESGHRYREIHYGERPPRNRDRRSPSSSTPSDREPAAGRRTAESGRSGYPGHSRRDRPH